MQWNESPKVTQGTKPLLPMQRDFAVSESVIGVHTACENLSESSHRVLPPCLSDREFSGLL